MYKKTNLPKGGSVESAAETRFVNTGDITGVHVQILLLVIQTDFMPNRTQPPFGR
jgi:hypothetical protein